MPSVPSALRSACHLPLLLASLGLTLTLSASAQAANRVLWANYNANSIGSADTAGGNGQTLLAGGAVNTPFGLAVDPGLGKVYWAEYANPGAIRSANLDGSGGATLVTDTGVRFPRGLTVDPSTHTLYWVNDTGDEIRRVNPNGTGNTLLYDQAGLPLQINDPQSPVVDPAHNRIYWANFLGGNIGYANLDGSGNPGTISFSGGCTTPTTSYSLALNPGADRLWFSGAVAGDPFMIQANLDGSGCSDVAGSAVVNRHTYGLAVDPDNAHLFVGLPNFSDPNGIGYWGLENLALAPSALDVAPAATNYALYPNVVAVPQGAATVTPASAQTGAQLSCTATWDPGSPSMLLFRAPASATAYSWSRDGATIAGAEAATLTADNAGSYRCTVSATNAAGAGSATSVPVTVSTPDNGGGGGGGGEEEKATSTTLAVSGKLPRSVRRKKRATLSISVGNRGSLAASQLRVCVRLPHLLRVSRQGIWKRQGGQYCRTLPSLAVGASTNLSLKLKAGRRAGQGQVLLIAGAANATSVSSMVRVRVR